MVDIIEQRGASAAAVAPREFASVGLRALRLVRGLPLVPRVIRGEVLSLREREFVKLAEIAGGSRSRIILRHILPNVMNSAMVLASLTIGVVIIAEASLSFLGIGVPPPEPAWGSMLADGRSMLMVGAWWLTVFPGLGILLVVLATQLLGDWLRVRLDPQLRNM